MQRHFPLLLGLLFQSLLPKAQINESFSDGDFIQNPAWQGISGAWTVNAASELQSSHVVANSSFYLSTPSSFSLMAEWSFFIRLNFNTSSANYVDVFLMASQTDPTLSSTTGYFVRIGNTQDEVSLYRKDPAGIVKLIDGTDGLTNASDNRLLIRVSRNASGGFILWRDLNLSGNFVAEGQATDLSYQTSTFFSILVRQSSSGFFEKHFFDDIQISDFIPDLIPPSILDLKSISSNELDILFSEPVNLQSSQNVQHYIVNQPFGNPDLAERDPTNHALVHLHFIQSFPSAQNLSITVNNIQDLAGNMMLNGSGSFSYYSLIPYDIIITEIMMDPSPQVGLPNTEYIELKNRSGRRIQLAGWMLKTAAGSVTFPAYELPADSFVLVTSASGLTGFSNSIRTIGINSFPSLDNDGELIALVSKDRKTIHAIDYDQHWYKNPAKDQGGWSLEMIDTHYPCAGAMNWKASVDASGGTPGRKNSVDAQNPDDDPPQLLRTISLDSISVMAFFDKSMDSLSASISSNYSIGNNIMILNANPQPFLFNQVVLRISAPMQKGNVYQLQVNQLKDCSNNTIGNQNKAPAGLPDSFAGRDVVLNEILFYPRPGAFDYVEIINRSQKILDAKKLFLSSKSATGNTGPVKKISESTFYLYPGDYLVLTEDANSLTREYFVRDKNRIGILSPFPSLPQDGGTVILSSLNGTIIDELNYTDKWHFALLNDQRGISLERIDPDGSSNEARNWHSASSTSGFGTPGYKNSQYSHQDFTDGGIRIFPETFSPDNDGHEDVLTISYELAEAGWIANIRIYDAAGRQVLYHTRNALLGRKGSWTWDGLGERSQQLPMGVYIIQTELFNLEGKKKQNRQTVVLVRKTR